MDRAVGRKKICPMYSGLPLAGSCCWFPQILATPFASSHGSNHSSPAWGLRLLGCGESLAFAWVFSAVCAHSRIFTSTPPSASYLPHSWLLFRLLSWTSSPDKGTLHLSPLPSKYYLSEPKSKIRSPRKLFLTTWRYDKLIFLVFSNQCATPH